MRNTTSSEVQTITRGAYSLSSTQVNALLNLRAQRPTRMHYNTFHSLRALDLIQTDGKELTITGARLAKALNVCEEYAPSVAEMVWAGMYATGHEAYAAQCLADEMGHEAHVCSLKVVEQSNGNCLVTDERDGADYAVVIVNGQPCCLHCPGWFKCSHMEAVERHMARPVVSQATDDTRDYFVNIGGKHSAVFENRDGGLSCTSCNMYGPTCDHVRAVRWVRENAVMVGLDSRD